MAQVHHYHAATREFIHSGTARMDPMDGAPLVPRHATLVAPPAAQAGMARVFDGDAWVYVEDHRSTTYWLPDGSSAVMASLGSLPDGALLAEPPPDPVAELAVERAAMICSPLQARIAMGDALLAQIDVYMADPETPREHRIAWEYAIELRRMSPVILVLTTQFGLTDAQVDDLFRLAMTIEV